MITVHRQDTLDEFVRVVTHKNGIVVGALHDVSLGQQFDRNAAREWRVGAMHIPESRIPTLTTRTRFILNHIRALLDMCREHLHPISPQPRKKPRKQVKKHHKKPVFNFVYFFLAAASSSAALRRFSRLPALRLSARATRRVRKAFCSFSEASILRSPTTPKVGMGLILKADSESLTIC